MAPSTMPRLSAGIHATTAVLPRPPARQAALAATGPRAAPTPPLRGGGWSIPSCCRGKIQRETAAAVPRIPGACRRAGTTRHLREQWRCGQLFAWRFYSSILARSPDPLRCKSELILPPHRRRRNGLFGLFRIVHGIARAFDGVVKTVLVDVDFSSIRQKFLQNLKNSLRATGH